MPSALFRILLLLSVSVIAACSHKSPVTPARPAYNGPGEIADIRSHPQDLNAYVGSNPQRRIIDMSSQSAQPLASGHTVRAQKRSVVHAEQQSPRLEERIGEVE